MKSILNMIYRFWWGTIYLRYLLLNKRITRDRIIEEYQVFKGCSQKRAEKAYAYLAGLEDYRWPKKHFDGFEYVNEFALKRRKWYMREGDLEWWYGHGEIQNKTLSNDDRAGVS